MKRNLTIFLLAAAIIAFISCESPFAEKLKRQNPAEGYGTVRVSVNGETDKSDGRTVFPSGLNKDIEYFYKFYTIKDGNEILADFERAEEEGVFILTAGTYTVKVEAFKGTALAAEGKSAAFNIAAGEHKTNTVKVILRPITGKDDGFFSFSVILPHPEWRYTYYFKLESTDGTEDTTISFVGNSNGFYNEDSFYTYDELTQHGNSYKFSSGIIQVPAGYYFFDLTVHDEAGEVITGKREVVHIYGGLITEITADKGWTFTPADFPAIVENVRDWAGLSKLLSDAGSIPLRIIITESIAFEGTIPINSPVTISANSEVTLSRGTTAVNVPFVESFVVADVCRGKVHFKNIFKIF